MGAHVKRGFPSCDGTGWLVLGMFASCVAVWLQQLVAWMLGNGLLSAGKRFGH